MKLKQINITDATIIVRIVLSIIVLTAVIWGARNGPALVLPAAWCGSTPVDAIGYVLSAIFSLRIGFDAQKLGAWSFIKLAAPLFSILLVAVVAAQIVAGCTVDGGWTGNVRFIVEVVVMCVLLIPCAVLYRRFR